MYNFARSYSFHWMECFYFTFLFITLSEIFLFYFPFHYTVRNLSVLLSFSLNFYCLTFLQLAEISFLPSLFCCLIRVRGFTTYMSPLFDMRWFLVQTWRYPLLFITNRHSCFNICLLRPSIHCLTFWHVACWPNCGGEFQAKTYQ